MRIKVEVTERDIRLGRRFGYHTQKCPIGRALSRFMKSCRCLYYTAEFENKDKDIEQIGLPKKCRVFQDKVLRNASVKPFSFSLSVPKGVL